MAYRLIVVDLDGTLLDPSSRITARTKKAIRAAAASGCVVTLATGRRFAAARPVAEGLGLELPIILHNGALVKDSVTGEILYHEPLPRGAAEEAVDAAVAYRVQPIVYENAGIGQGLFAGPSELDGPYAGPYLARAGSLLRRLPYHQLVPPELPTQMAIYDRAERIGCVEAALRHAGVRATTSITSSGGSFLELINAACSKATGIAHFARTLEISLSEVMAIGDNFNDVEMLREVGLGIAMGNAPEAVRRHARAVTGTNAEDGVAQAIEKYVLSYALHPRPDPRDPGDRGAPARGSRGRRAGNDETEGGRL